MPIVLNIDDNTIDTSGRYGVHLSNLNNNAFIDNNEIFNSGTSGVFVTTGNEYPAEFYYSHDINTMNKLTVTNNTISHSENDGVYVNAFIANTQINTNKISYADNGIVVDGLVSGNAGVFYGPRSQIWTITNNNFSKIDVSPIVQKNLKGNVKVTGNVTTP